MSDAVAHQFFFDGVKRGILFGVEWNTLSTAINRLKKKVITFEEDFVNPLAHRLGPQLHSLAQQPTFIPINIPQPKEIIDLNFIGKVEIKRSDGAAIFIERLNQQTLTLLLTQFMQGL